MANELPELDEKLIEAVHWFACPREVNSKSYKDNIAKGNDSRRACIYMYIVFKGMEKGKYCDEFCN